MNIPIIVIAYNRRTSLERLLNSLAQAHYPDKVELIISIDCGNNKDVLDCANQFEWNHGKKEVIYREVNLGLKKHILSCGDMALKYDAIIMLEDDLYVARDFYDYALAAFDFVKNDNRIGGVSLYNHKLNFLTRRRFETLYDGYDNWYFQYASSWGQMWTREQWQSFREWYGENQEYNFEESKKMSSNIKKWGKHSWLKYYIAYLVETDRYFFYPRIAFATNYTEAGTNHKRHDTDYQVSLALRGSKSYRFATINESFSVYDIFFENTRICNLMGYDDMCVDLYGTKKDYGNSQYLITSADIEGGDLVCSYGREVRPHELNVIEGIPGHVYKIYKRTSTFRKKRKGYKSKQEAIAYDFAGLSYSDKRLIALSYVRDTVTKIVNKLVHK